MLHIQPICSVKIANAYSTFPSSDRAPRPAEARRGYPRRPPPPQAAYGGRLIFAPGSSLGGARPKASVVDQHGHLSIAKFPKETDDYSMETWEEIALRLAGQACIATPQHELVEVAGKSVMLSRRFDRDGAIRIPFLSAMAMMGARDGERASYPEIVDALAQHGAQGKTDAHALYRRVAFNVLISNVDDHLRNHGFLWLGKAGWSLSPAYDRAHAGARPSDHQRGRARDRDMARDREGRRRPVGRDHRMASAFEHDDLTRALAL